MNTTLLNGKTKNRQTIFIIFLSVITFFRIGLFLRIPYYALGGSGYDDMYMLTLSEYIYNGWWLGDYCYTTLLKVVSYPVFVAISNWLCIPYPLLLAAFYCVSSFLFAYALFLLFKSKFIFTISYIFILFSPVSFSDAITQKLYRNVLIFPSVVLIIASALLAFYFIRINNKRYVIWLCLLGGSLSFFYYLREDSIWIWPLVIIMLTSIAIILVRNAQIKRAKLILLLIPFVIFGIVTLGYKSLNYYKYGIFATDDRSSGSFPTLMSNIIKIKDDSNPDHVQYWVTKNTLEKVCDNCPTLAKDKELIMQKYCDWILDGNDNVDGDSAIFALREAFNNLGYYSSPSVLNNACTQINQELLNAIADGRLEFDDAIHFSKLSRGIYLSEIPGFISDALHNIFDISLYHGAETTLLRSSGYEGHIRFMESITSTLTIHQPTNETNIYGWLILKNAPSQFSEVKLVNDNTIKYASLSSGDGTVNYLPEYPSESRISFHFLFDGSISGNDELQIWNSGELLYSGNLESYEDDTVFIHIDYIGNNSTVDYYETYSSHIVSICQAIIVIFKATSFVILPLSIICFIFMFIAQFKEKQIDCLVLFQIAFLSSSFVLSLGVTIFCSWLKGALWYYCAGGLLACIQCFELISIADCVFWIQGHNH